MWYRCGVAVVVCVLCARCVHTPAGGDTNELIQLSEEPFPSPVVISGVEFFLEGLAQVGLGSYQVDPLSGTIYVDGMPVVRRLRYSIYEIDGRRYHFARGSKVYVFQRRPQGQLHVQVKNLRLCLVGHPDERFVVSYRCNGEEVVQYGITKLYYSGGRWRLEGGAPVGPGGVRLTRTGKITFLLPQGR